MPANDATTTLAMLAILLLLVFCSAGAARASNKLYVLPKTNGRSQSTLRFAPLFALPARQQQGAWQYLPLDKTRKPSAWALFASRLSLINVGSRNDWQKYLPPSSTLRLAKALLKQQQQQLAVQLPAAGSVVEAVGVTASSALWVPTRWILLFRIVLEVIAKKVRSLTFAPTAAAAAAAAAAASEASYAQTAVSTVDARAWSAAKLREIEKLVVARPAAAAQVQAQVQVEVQAEAQAMPAAAQGKASYWPMSAKHLSMVQAAKEAAAAAAAVSAAPVAAAAVAAPAETVTAAAPAAKETYWPARRYW